MHLRVIYTSFTDPTPMSNDSNTTLDQWAEQSDYKWGFVTDIDADTLPPGLNEDVIRIIRERYRTAV